MQTIATTNLTREVGSYLRAHDSLTLSTSSFTGLPHANTAPYLSDDHKIYFYAREGSVLLRNLGSSHHAAFTVDDYASSCQKRQELHGTGHCGLVEDQAEIDHVSQLASEKFGERTIEGILCWLEPVGMYFVNYQDA